MTSRGIKKLVDTDVYWGEFDESHMDELLRLCREQGIDAAREFARSVLSREDFIFGTARSDFIPLLDVDEQSVCLDCGCGLGVHTFNIASQAKEVHAFDLSLKRVEFVECRKQGEGFDNVYLYHSDFTRLPFKDQTFDVIIMNGIVEWLGEINRHGDPRDDQVAVLTQLHALLKPGGRLYIGIENRWALAYLKGYDHNGIRFTNFFPRTLANLITRIKRGKPYRTYTYGIRGYSKLLFDSGFTYPPKFFIAHPGYNFPQYLIDLANDHALRFFYTAFSHNKGIRGLLVRSIVRYSLGCRLLRNLVWSYVIVAYKK